MSTNAVSPVAAASGSTPVPPLPFHHAAKEHTEPAFDVSGIVPGANSQMVLQGASQALPADGYLRDVYLRVKSSGGVAGAGVAAPDYPWNIIDSASLNDVNGAPLMGPIDGYSLYLVNKYGGYMFRGDPLIAPDASTSVAAPEFALRLPLEINRQTGFGSLANHNAAAAYKCVLQANNSAALYSTAPTTVPTLEFAGTIETWTQPTPTDAMGRPQETEPPAHGTTQFWTTQQYTINAGKNTITLTRVGNLIRALILVYRDATGARVLFSSGHLPDPIEIDWDARQYKIDPLYMRREDMINSYGAAEANTAEDGVIVYNWDKTILGHTGGGSSAMYMPTVEATRLNIVGTFGVAGTLTVITNDIAPVETNPALRYAMSSQTGFHPQVGTPIAGAGG